MKAYTSSLRNAKSTKTKMGAWAPKATRGRRRDAFGKTRRDVTACRFCKSWFVGKRWVHDSEVREPLPESVSVRFAICPACQMTRDRTFEGEIVIESFDKRLKEEMLNMVKHVGDEAFLRDSQDRVLRMEDTRNAIRITTSENQLALRIGKKLKSAFKGTLDIRWSKDDEVVRVKWRGQTHEA